MSFPSGIFEYKMMIRESHLDTFGHVNNAKYLEIFEEARWDLVTKNGFGLEDVHKKQIGPIILAVTLEFKKEIKNRQIINVTTQCLEYNGKVGKLEQKILNEAGVELCNSVFTFGLFDLKARRLINPTPEWLNAVGHE